VILLLFFSFLQLFLTQPFLRSFHLSRLVVRLVVRLLSFHYRYCITAGVFLLYYKVRRGSAGSLSSLLNAETLPLLLLYMLVHVLFFPRSKRAGVLRSIKETVIAPFGRVGFRESIVADFATSLVKPNIGETALTLAALP